MNRSGYQFHHHFTRLGLALIVRHAQQVADEQALAAVAPETRRAYEALVGG